MMRLYALICYQSMTRAVLVLAVITAALPTPIGSIPRIEHLMPDSRSRNCRQRDTGQHVSGFIASIALRVMAQKPSKRRFMFDA